MDGEPYFRSFSYLFGIEAAGGCHRGLDGRRVKVRYLQARDDPRRLALQITELATGLVWGNTEQASLAQRRYELQDRSTLVALKVLCGLVALWPAGAGSLVRRVSGACVL